MEKYINDLLKVIKQKKYELSATPPEHYEYEHPDGSVFYVLGLLDGPTHGVDQGEMIVKVKDHTFYHSIGEECCWEESGPCEVLDYEDEELVNKLLDALDSIPGVITYVDDVYDEARLLALSLGVDVSNIEYYGFEEELPPDVSECTMIEDMDYELMSFGKKDYYVLVDDTCDVEDDSCAFACYGIEKGTIPDDYMCYPTVRLLFDKDPNEGGNIIEVLDSDYTFDAGEY